jgi:hypothetical protein
MATMVSTAQRQESLTAHPFRDFPIGRCPSADQSCTVTAYNFDDSNHNFPLPPPLDGLWWSWHGPCPWKLAINIFRHHEGCRRGGGECANEDLLHTLNEMRQDFLERWTIHGWINFVTISASCSPTSTATRSSPKTPPSHIFCFRAFPRARWPQAVACGGSAG